MAQQVYDGNPEHYSKLWEEGYSFKMSQYISRGWEIFTKQTGSYIGFTLLMFLMIMAASFIPMVGVILSPAFSAILLGGFYIATQKIAKGQTFEFGDFFKGFDHFAQLGLVGVVRLLILYIPIIIFVIALIVFAGISFDSFDNFDPDSTFFIPIVLGVIVVMIHVMYFSIAYIFSEPLVALGKLEFWPAMETSRKIITKRWWNFFLFYLFFVLVFLVGFLLLFVGIIAAIPFTYCMMYAAFEDIAGNKDAGWEDQIDEIGIKVEEINDFDDV